MGGHGLKRQRQAARKRAKRQAERNKRGPTEGKKASLLQEAQRAASCPVYECLSSGSISESGIGNVMMARRFPDTTIGFAVFLVDVYCLGVKDAMFASMTRDQYAMSIDALRSRENLVPMDPCCARKLVERSIAYAKRLGFTPHSDYVLAKPLLADIDTEACETEFEFGRDGKPFYVAGPNDSPAKVKRIINTLSRRVGRDGFNFLVPGESTAAFGTQA